MGEAWVAPPERLARYVRQDELHSTFNFDFLCAGWNAADMRAAIENSTRALAEVGAAVTWVLSNHDVVRHATRYGRAPGRENDPAGSALCDMKLGIQRARAAALLQLALPGAAYLYQGDELGLPEVEDLPEAVLCDPMWERSERTNRGRDGCRVPLPWSGDEPPYGFGISGSWLPQPPSWRGYTAREQSCDPESMLELYRAALRIRRDRLRFAGETIQWLDAPEGVLLFARGEDFACMVNLSDRAVPLPPNGVPLLASGRCDRLLLADHAVWLHLN